MVTSWTASRPLRAVLVIDALFELAVGGMLLLFRDEFASGLNVANGAVIAAGILFLVAGLVLVGILVRPSSEAVRWVAVLNLAGGLALWLMIALNWGDLDSDPRWFATAVANTSLALAALQGLSLRRG